MTVTPNAPVVLIQDLKQALVVSRGQLPHVVVQSVGKVVDGGEQLAALLVVQSPGAVNVITEAFKHKHKHKHTSRTR